MWIRRASISRQTAFIYPRIVSKLQENFRTHSRCKMHVVNQKLYTVKIKPNYVISFSYFAEHSVFEVRKLARLSLKRNYSLKKVPNPFRFQNDLSMFSAASASRISAAVVDDVIRRRPRNHVRSGNLIHWFPQRWKAEIFFTGGSHAEQDPRKTFG